MKKVLFACAIAAMSMAAYAGEIENKDNVDYKVELVTGNSTRTLNVSSHSRLTTSDVKAGAVVKMIKDGQKFTVGSDDVVVIENGKLRKK